MNKKKPLTKEQLDDAKRLKSIYMLKKNELCITQEDIADQLGIGQAAVSHYLNGVNPLNAKTVALFAKLLKVKPSDISPSIALELEEIAKLMLPTDYSYMIPDNSYTKLTKIEENLLDMFNALTQEEQKNYLKEIAETRANLERIYKEMKEKEKKSKRAL
ncbi:MULTISPECIES: helix-turn-helix domain-containing protein [unclassified Arsenophonus]|uniref:helix-turn-helix domain-containing protein n=1 Tax=unclassified Arsenophonus TaxID=2627083 RepID=UPI0028554379|nr:helix-turn-helix domain-containing protein [Arsenophonus sp.]MDR5611283.1 helix-turn-helix domain-containing protein [Arsenophonus sp.]MDR5615358.1 helix-turn-helix domain-containing protein [Arsenophonus sp.]